MARRAQVVLGLAVLIAFALASSPSQGAPGAKPPDFDKAVAAMEKHADKWLDKPNVVGVGIGENKAGKAVIHVYKVKDDDDGIPSDVDGVAVAEFATGRFDPRAAPTDRWPRPVPIGVSGGLADFATGTLGARVTDGTNVYVLSNNHVLAGVNTASIGDPITQPGVEDGGSDPADRIATLAAYQEIDFGGGDNVMDAAIAQTTAGELATATPPDGYGSPSTTPTVASIGMGVQKYGRTTGLQLGSVQDVNFAVDVCYFALGEFCFPGFEARFVNQIAVSGPSFSAPGDSGSLIVTQGGNQPVALLFAGDGTLTIGNPIGPVLQRFNVTIEGGAPVDGPPSAAQNLSALAGDARVTLAWSAPSFDGGSPVSGYKVYRATSPGVTNLSPVVGTPSGTTFTDTSALNGTTYYYKVSALNPNGESALSNEANATPIAAVAPGALSTPIDDFNRPNETLSDGGRWTNAIIGGENGLNVSSNQLACAVTTTCTAWRNDAQFGPEVEVWARLTTLPGLNNQLRLNARLRFPGPTGYVLRTNQTSGGSEVWLERFNGGLTRLLTIPTQLAAGDTMLLRASGSTIEAWRLPSGGSWSRLGVAQDATYAAGGYVGVGLRGTTGRVDDFGARTLGGPPPDTEPPSTPGTLTASAVSSTRIDLSWGAATDNSGTVARYRIERCAGAGCGGADFAEIGTSTGTTFQNTGLTPQTSYSYRVRAEDGATPPNQGSYSNVTTESTPAPPDTEPPSAPGTLSASAFSDSQIELTWGPATDDSGGVILYRIERCEGVGCSDFAEVALETSTTHMDVGLNASTSYSYRVRAEDAAEKRGPYSNVATQSTPAPPDTTPPSAPGTLTASAVSQSQIDLSWGAATDNSGTVARYRIERCAGVGCGGTDFAEVGTSTGTTFQNTGLAAQTSYSYRVRAEDGATPPNQGPYSNVTTQSTPAPPDTTPPSAPGTLTASAASSTRIDLSWGAATDDSGTVSLYRIERCEGPSCADFSEIATTTGLGFENTGLTPQTSYSYRVRAEDGATPPNQGPYGNVATATTSADITPPVEPLTVLDTFNRANQKPLGSQWGDGIAGKSERSLKVVSNQCASDRNSLATAWWQTQLAADSEAYATVATLPGNGNGVRLYVRLQTPGSSAVDGYMLNYNQVSGTDQIQLYRVTNGASTLLASVNREVAAGDRLLVRANGTNLESWIHSGSSWTRLTQVTDSTYTGPGFAGVGIRGRTGRVDDFGGR